MNSTVSASGSQNKSTGATPFDEIAQTEAAQAERVQKEKEGFASEKAEIEKTIEEERLQDEETLKGEAKKDLKAFSEDTLATKLKDSENEAEAECSKIESSFESKKNDAISSLEQKVLDSSFLATAL